ncbi:hypothetical protein [Frankia sp. Cr1]|uniref:hypothetical protein n=1 Tax=Frankia sp. Cr1 TaxID=3073931 RepID=UPI002AD3B2CF|nr:hypothetical protein [Frankia sp. Cr1]
MTTAASPPVFDHLIMLDGGRTEESRTGTCAFFPGSPDNLITDQEGNVSGLCGRPIVARAVSRPGSSGVCAEHADHVQDCRVCAPYLEALERFTV